MNEQLLKLAVTRHDILGALSDDEVARVSSETVCVAVGGGDEYVDLSHLDCGVQRAQSNTKLETPNWITRCAVSEASWLRIVMALGTTISDCSPGASK
ncbi:MAG: hypothetical protein ABJE66_26845 [Deltaproteobacteria bacterium]